MALSRILVAWAAVAAWLVGYGADAICPRLALETVAAMAAADKLGGDHPSPAEAQRRFRAAVEDGVLKVMAKMGISDVASYRGAQIFETLGLAREVVDACLVGTPGALGGVGFAELEREALERLRAAYEESPRLENPGYVKYRKGGEPHATTPEVLFDETARFLHLSETSLPEAQRELLRRLSYTDPALAGKTVLVVDDDIRNIFAITAVLEGLAQIQLARGEALQRFLRALEVPERRAPVHVEHRDEGHGEQGVDRGHERGEVAGRRRHRRVRRRRARVHGRGLGKRRLRGPLGGRRQDVRAAATRAAKSRRAGSEWPTSSSGCHCTPSTKRDASSISAPSTI